MRILKVPFAAGECEFCSVSTLIMMLYIRNLKQQAGTHVVFAIKMDYCLEVCLSLLSKSCRSQL